ncbi:MAG: transporter substrate-binding domain-containing protein [Nitriliruptorales bacterium]|nr:transporter substrate-binding domain-containing protein [Nitriliruptorales bacterium]
MREDTLTRKLLLLLALVLALVATACTDGGGDQAGEEGGEPGLEATDGAAVQTEQTDGTGADAGGTGESVLQDVQSRGTLRCGVNEEVPGFGFTTEEGEFEGFDIDFCRVVAAAVLGDSEAVEFVSLTAEQRFTALQSGEIDVLIRNTTWTASRDGGEEADFTLPTFYDGQAFMVKGDAGVGAIDDLDGSDVCTLSGTTTELNLTTEAEARGLDINAITFDDNDQLIQAFQADRCDAWTSDASQLAGVRSTWPDGEGGPEALTILDEIISKEPLGPAVREGDADWFDAVNWAVIATIQAEEFEITQDNLEEMRQSDDPNILRLLGEAASDEEPTLDPGLGLDTDFAVNVIEQVGNYGEIFERNVGADSNLGLERGLNAQWTDGGLHYAPPYR